MEANGKKISIVQCGIVLQDGQSIKSNPAICVEDEVFSDILSALMDIFTKPKDYLKNILADISLSAHSFCNLFLLDYTDLEHWEDVKGKFWELLGIKELLKKKFSNTEELAEALLKVLTPITKFELKKQEDEERI